VVCTPRHDLPVVLKYRSLKMPVMIDQPMLDFTFYFSLRNE
jgi:hypothetical protein